MRGYFAWLEVLIGTAIWIRFSEIYTSLDDFFAECKLRTSVMLSGDTNWNVGLFSWILSRYCDPEAPAHYIGASGDGKISQAFTRNQMEAETTIRFVSTQFDSLFGIRFVLIHFVLVTLTFWTTTPQHLMGIQYSPCIF